MKDYKYPAEFARKKLKLSEDVFYTAIGRGRIRAEGPVNDRWVYLPFEIIAGKDYFTTAEAAEKLGFMRNYIIARCRKDKGCMPIECVRIGGQYRIPESEIERILEERHADK